MIMVKSKYDCCGCEACVQRCPHNAIELTQDNEGFLYPQINMSICTNCGLCERVCPIINQELPSELVKAFAAKNNDKNIRQQSSSGGIFTLLATVVINNGGVVFGAKFNSNWEVEHDYTNTISGLTKFQGSKYVQSKIGNNYILAEKYLKDGKQVLFSGTPCQIAGLKRFLRKEYENLVCVDIICHGVPSPLVWQEYLKSLKLDKVTYITFRDKTTGWSNASFTIKNEDEVIFTIPRTRNPYLTCSFVGHLCLRPACSDCKFKYPNSCSDISLGDFWGVDYIFPKINDNIGISLININSEQGHSFIKSLNLDYEKVDIDDVIKYNPAIKYSFKFNNENRTRFWRDFHLMKANAIYKHAKRYKLSIYNRIILKIKYLLNK